MVIHEPIQTLIIDYEKHEMGSYWNKYILRAIVKAGVVWGFIYVNIE